MENQEEEKTSPLSLSSVHKTSGLERRMPGSAWLEVAQLQLSCCSPAPQLSCKLPGKRHHAGSCHTPNSPWGGQAELKHQPAASDSS